MQPEGGLLPWLTLSAPPPPTSHAHARSEKVAYYRIANHYKFLLRTFFDCLGFERLIILEVGGCGGL